MEVNSEICCRRTIYHRKELICQVVGRDAAWARNVMKKNICDRRARSVETSSIAPASTQPFFSGAPGQGTRPRKGGKAFASWPRLWLDHTPGCDLEVPFRWAAGHPLSRRNLLENGAGLG